jgi:enoyl-CoA hydratase/carnithine racemase
VGARHGGDDRRQQPDRGAGREAADQQYNRRPCGVAGALEQELGDRVRRSEHFKEGVRAFLEKRTPNYP